MQLNALERLGEFFLAEQLMRYDLLHGETAMQRQSAFKRLLAAQEREGDRNGRLERMRMNRVFDTPDATIDYFEHLDFKPVHAAEAP